jgi:spermidine synthase
MNHLHQLAKVFSSYQEITICEANQLFGEIGKFRYLEFSGEAVQGAIDLKDPKRIVLEYPRAIIHLMESNNPSFENAFIIGHGIGTIAGHFLDKTFKVAEIDEEVVKLSREFFDYLQDNVVVGDGRDLLSIEEPHTLDYIILDAFTKEGTPYHFTTKEFFEMTQDRLNSRGAIIMNLMGKSKNDKLINAIHTTLSETYAYSKALVLPGEDAADIRNIIIIGSSKTIDFQTRAMAGFIEIELGEGHIIADRETKSLV